MKIDSRWPGDGLVGLLLIAGFWLISIPMLIGSSHLGPSEAALVLHAVITAIGLLVGWTGIRRGGAANRSLSAGSLIFFWFVFLITVFVCLK